MMFEADWINRVLNSAQWISIVSSSVLVLMATYGLLIVWKKSGK